MIPKCNRILDFLRSYRKLCKRNLLFGHFHAQFATPNLKSTFRFGMSRDFVQVRIGYENCVDFLIRGGRGILSFLVKFQPTIVNGGLSWWMSLAIRSLDRCLRRPLGLISNVGRVTSSTTCVNMLGRSRSASRPGPSPSGSSWDGGSSLGDGWKA